MAYGILKVDNITFDNGGSDQNVTVSGLYRATTSGVTLSGTIVAATVSGVTVIGSTTVSGATVTGTTANFTSGNFSNIISSAATMSGALIMANQQQVRFREAVGNGVNHIALQAPAIVSADQTITLPDQTGTVITTGDNGSVSSTMLATNLTISAAAGSATTPSIAFTGDLNTGIYSPGADQLAVATNGTGRLFVDSNGNVGIGTIAGAGKLEVAVSGNRTIGNQWDNKSILIGTPGAFSGNLGLSFDTTNGATIESAAPGVASYPVRIAGSEIQLFTASAERARIDSSGRLLVGTSSSVSDTFGASLAQVSVTDGNAASFGRYSADAFAPIVYLKKSRGALGAQGIVSSGDNVGSLLFTGSDGVGFIQAATIKTEVDGTPGANDMPGRLVFSTTADGAASPTERMRIVNTGTTSIFASTANVLGAGSNQAAGTTYYLFYGANNASSTTTGTTCFLVYTNGNVQNTNNSYGGISDAKLKENIVDAASQWSDIKALQVRKYNFKEGQTHTQIGLVAQEVELVSPGLVTKSPDRDAEGNDLGTVTKSVNYSVLYMKAVKALQEAMERIETLEAAVAALQGA